MDFTYLQSPVCRLFIAGEDGILNSVRFLPSQGAVKPPADWRFNAKSLKETIHQLEAYFAGELKQFSLKIAFKGTAFQSLVWNTLRQSTYGETITYSELARQIGKPKACRAVGAAAARNPLPIVIPCHRVVGSNGKLVGFGGGLELKQALLDHEHEHI